MGKRRAPKGALENFLVELVASPPTHCVDWPFGRSEGYGRINWRGKSTSAHRVSLELYTGTTGEVAAHKPVECHNKLCVNPLHLRWATQAENVMDKVADKTMAKGVTHGRSRLNEQQVLEAYAGAENQRFYATKFSVGRVTIANIRSGKTWSHLTGHPQK